MAPAAPSPGEVIARAWLEGGPVGTGAGVVPSDVAAAYRLQAAATDVIVAAEGCRQVGYKLGLTTEQARRAVGAAAPFHGPLLSSRVWSASRAVRRCDFTSPLLEVEVVVKLGERDPSTGRSPLSSALGIEIPDVRVPPAMSAAGAVVTTISDLAAHGGLVVGSFLDGVPTVGSAEVVRDGEVHVRGTVAPDADPLAAVRWLEEDLALRGLKPLAAGSLVATGALLPPAPLDPGRYRVTLPPFPPLTFDVV